MAAEAHTQPCGWRTAVSPDIEREYDLRAAFPDYAGYFADWRERSRAVRRDLAPLLDVAYGSGARERLDIFSVRGSKQPMLVYIHGGYWRAMDKSDFSFIAAPFAARGIPLALVNYTLCPEGSISGIVAQMRAACLWLAGHAREFDAMPRELHLVGWSAGAHLAAMMAATHWPRDASGRAECVIRSVLAISGVYDLHPVRHTTANEDLRMDGAEAQRNSPLFLAPDPAVEVAIACGALETAAFRAQSRALADKWRTAAVLELPGRHHYAAMAALGDADSELFRVASRLAAAQ